MAKKILIIEDEVALADAMKVGLTDAGYEADTAYDGEDGMVKVKSLTPDLVLLDLMLPKKDGMTILKEMRADSATADIPVMILSQLSDTEKISEGVSLGVVGYLVKVDFSLAEVVEKVKKALGD
ncbi:response regulator transcription factor [Candidatus Kuenenbacteria bacterium]|nr:response regulator transcription factor [Candidatus Kuenenbacteria bacterium]